MGDSTRRPGPGKGAGRRRALKKSSARSRGDRQHALDALARLNPSRADDRDDWIRVGMALHSVDEDLLDVWDEWSRQSPKYRRGECRRQWSSFRRCGGVTIASLVRMAKQDQAHRLRTRRNRKKPVTHRELPLRGKEYTRALHALTRRMQREASGPWQLECDYPYHDADGQHVLSQVRYSSPSAKTFRPLCRTGRTWKPGAFKNNSPLYRLGDLSVSPEERVHVVEGEKDSDALAELGLVATTSQGGAQAAKKTDWSPLAGRDVVVLPDNDAAGRKYAEEVRRILLSLNPPAEVRVVDLPGLDAKADCFDFIEDRRAAELEDDAIRAEIERLVSDAPERQAERPTLATDNYTPFPLRSLPEPVRSFVVEAASMISCDPAYVALPLMAALASAIGASRSIKLKDGWTEPSTLWTAIVARSGSMKSPAFRAALEEPHRREILAQKRYKEQLREYEEHQKRLKVQKKRNATSKPSRRVVVEDDPEEPEKPRLEQHVVDDTTVEALCVVLDENPRGVLLARDELSAWFGSFNEYKRGGGSDEGRWLSIHGAHPLKINRKTGDKKIISVPLPFVSIAGGIQTRVLRRVLGDEFRASGLAARLLMAMPPERPKQWSEETVSTATREKMRRLFDSLRELDMDCDDDGLAFPRPIRLNPAAKRVWVQFVDAHGEEQAREMDDDIVSAWSKLEGYAARFALVFHVVRWAAGDGTLRREDSVDRKSISDGIQLSQWFGGETRRIYAVLREGADDESKRIMVERIRMAGGHIKVRDWQRARSWATTEEAEAELRPLVEAGFGTFRITTPGPKGGRPSKSFVLHDAPITPPDRTPGETPSEPVLSVSDPSSNAEGRSAPKKRVARKRPATRDAVGSSGSEAIHPGRRRKAAKRSRRRREA